MENSKGKQKQMYVFEGSEYIVTWWPSTQIMLFQGNPDVCDAITAHLEKILNRLQGGDNALDIVEETRTALNIVEETKTKPKKTTTAKSGKKSGMKTSPKKSKSSTNSVLDIVEEKDQETKQIWEAIEGLRTLILSKDNIEKIPVNAYKIDEWRTVNDCLLKFKQAKDNRNKKNDTKDLDYFSQMNDSKNNVAIQKRSLKGNQFITDYFKPINSKTSVQEPKKQ